MQRYFWFHPNYIQEEKEKTIKGQKENAEKNNYIILRDDELYKVRATDHLTIIGHSTSPEETQDPDDTGLYIQGDNANKCVARLKKLGLRHAPKLLSLECCYAAQHQGVAEQLSKHPFFKYSLIEASTAAVGRNPGMGWGMHSDRYGRSLFRRGALWFFFISGYSVATYQHDSYALEDVLSQISPQQFHVTFFNHYKPGWFGGRVGRCCAANKSETNLEQVLFFANEKTASATKDALDLTLKELYEPNDTTNNSKHLVQV